MYRVGLEAILGFTKRGETLEMDPCIPAGWPEFSMTYRHGSSTYAIMVRNPHGAQRGVAGTTLDGAPVTGPVPLVDDSQRHEVIVTLGPPTPSQTVG
jgi:Cellobiose phosphorylase